MAEAGDRPGSAGQEAEAISVGLSAVVVAVTDDEPRVLVVYQLDEGLPDGLPAGPLQPRHRTLQGRRMRSGASISAG